MSGGTKPNEISRFTAGGKTFFFNKGEAKNGTPFLAINAIYGQGNQQRMGLFPSQMLEFFNHFKGALEAITGLTPAGAPAQMPEVNVQLPFECPRCEAGPWEFMLSAAEHGTEWHVYCSSCQEYITSSFKDQPHV